MILRLSTCVATATSVALAALIVPATAAAVPSCGDLGTELSAGPAIQTDNVGQFQIPLIMTNIGNESCTTQDRLDVVLIGPDDPTWGPTYQLWHVPGDPQQITIAPGGSASSVVTLLSGEPDGRWVPTTIMATLPGSDSYQGIPWDPGRGSVLRQDGATAHGSYIGPLKVGSHR